MIDLILLYLVFGLSLLIIVVVELLVSKDKAVLHEEVGESVYNEFSYLRDKLLERWFKIHDIMYRVLRLNDDELLNMISWVMLVILLGILLVIIY
jgi:hypothetical protein